MPALQCAGARVFCRSNDGSRNEETYKAKKREDGLNHE